MTEKEALIITTFIHGGIRRMNPVLCVQGKFVVIYVTLKKGVCNRQNTSLQMV